jgi:hypothetical protein
MADTKTSGGAGREKYQMTDANAKPPAVKGAIMALKRLESDDIVFGSKVPLKQALMVLLGVHFSARYRTKRNHQWY